MRFVDDRLRKGILPLRILFRGDNRLPVKLIGNTSHVEHKMADITVERLQLPAVHERKNPGHLSPDSDTYL